MSISKKKRHLVYEKCRGHCAYCGREITLKQMQVDHIAPQCFTEWESNPTVDGQPTTKDPDRMDNLLPSCYRCNHYKRSYSLEQYRGMVATVHERIAKIYIVQVAMDYKILTMDEMLWDGKFYFEKQQNQEQHEDFSEIPYQTKEG